jgi:hypothetical protein
MNRPFVALWPALLALALAATAANAAWQPPGGSAGAVSAQALGRPTAPAATPTSTSSITISWGAPVGLAPSQYVVHRTAPTAATVCTVPGGTLSCPDTGLAAATTYTYTVEAHLGAGWVSVPTAPVSATTFSPPNFLVAVAGTQTAGTSFPVFIRATTNGVTTDTSYTGSHALTFSGPANSPSGTPPTYPATVTFAAGVGTAVVKLVDAQVVPLQVTDGVRSGSTSVTVQAAAATGLVYTNSNVSCASGSAVVGIGGSFITFVSTVDTYGNLQTVPFLRIAVSRAPNSGTLVPTRLVVQNSSQTSQSTTYKRRPRVRAPNVRVTASAAGYTSVVCVVKAQ